MSEVEHFRIDTEIDSNKPNILVLFKHMSRWNVHVLKILELRYNAYYGYFLDYYKEFNTLEIREYLRTVQKDFNFRALLVDPEWCDVFNIATIELFEEVLPVGIMAFDDTTMHDYNQMLASTASFVVIPDPIKILEYKLIDIETVYLAPHAECLYPTVNTPPEYDVLWFGYDAKADRLEFIDELRKMDDIKVNIYTGPKKQGTTMSGDLSWEEMVSLIGSAKIVINLSKSDFPMRCAPYNFLPRAEVYQIPGRLIETGYIGRLCISQYAPQHEACGMDKVLPEFRTPEEMVQQIRHVLNSGELETYTKNYCDFINDYFSNEKQVNALHEVVERVNKPHHRYITRINQKYYDIASAGIKRFQYATEERRALEMELLNKAATRVQMDFRTGDRTVPPNSRSKVLINRN